MMTRPVPRMVFLALIAASALGVRLGAVAALRGFSAPPSHRHGADGVEYDALGARLANEGQYALPGQGPSSFRAPGFPLFLAGIYRTAGRRLPLVYGALACLGAASCVLTYFLAREVAPEATARVAAALAVVYLPHVLFATRFDSENLFVPLLAGAPWLFLRHAAGGATWLVAGSGLLLGLAALTRPFALLLLPPWLALLALRRDRPPRRRAVSAAAFAASFVAAVAPWTLRNQAVHGRPVLIATNGGSTFYGSNNDLVATRWPHLGGWVSTGRLPGRDRIDATPDEVAHDKLEWALGLRWVRAHPRLLPQLLAAKLARFWLPDVDSPNRSYVALQWLTYPPLLALMAAGWAALHARREYRELPWRTLRATLLATVLTALIFWGSPRFRDANAPILMVYAATGLVTLASRRGRSPHVGPS